MGYFFECKIVNTNTRNKIVDEVRELLDKDFTKIIIDVNEGGFTIVPMKEIKLGEKKSVLKSKKGWGKSYGFRG